MTDSIVIQYKPMQTKGDTKKERCNVVDKAGSTYYLNNPLGDDIEFNSDTGEFIVDGELWGTEAEIVEED